MAIRSRDALKQALNGRAFTITRNGSDRYGRTLAKIRFNGEDVGDGLIAQGLAHKWRGYKEEWC
ncbi:MAG: thermonuclease family protein [Mesorhizobium sp.]